MLKIHGFVWLFVLSLFGAYTNAHAGGADLTWTASTSDNSILTGYKVHRGTVAGGPYVVTQTLGRVTTASETGLTAGTKYFWVVTAFGPGGESVRSNEASAIIPFAVPVGATGLNVQGTP